MGVITTIPMLELSGITKVFGGVRALSEVELEVAPGSVHGIVGENGAGKSTLMKIISGALVPDGGRIVLRGEEVTFNGPRDAAERGIAMVYQEPTFYPHLTVLENFYTGEEMVNRWGSIQWGTMLDEAVEAIAEFGLDASILKKPMSELSMGDQQLVLIARAAYRDAELIILDEPTSILSQAETDILFGIMRRLQEQGKSVLYISHRLKEVFAVCDRITVLRDGDVVGSLDTADATEDLLIQMMTGRELQRSGYTEPSINADEMLLDVSNISCEPIYRNISFTIAPGEIVGFYGLVGSGRSEVARTIFGDLKMDEGAMEFKGKRHQPKSPKEAIRDHIAYLPEDRQRQGVFDILSTGQNLICAIMDRLAKMGWLIRKDREAEIASNCVSSLRIKLPGLDSPIGALSGGNQQKVVIGRWIASEPDLMILDEPTRGVDVGTKEEIHRLVRCFAEDGKGIMLISSDLPEILALSHRIIVMHEGDQVAELAHAEATEEAVLKHAIGLGAGSD